MQQMPKECKHVNQDGMCLCAIMKRKKGYEKANQEHNLYNCLNNRGYFTDKNELNFKL